MKKTKIVFGVNDFLMGGMQRQFAQQAWHFDRERFEIVLITLLQFPHKPNMYAELPGDLPVYKLSFHGWNDLRAWWALYRLLRTIRPDIVVSSLFFANTVFRILKSFVGYVSVAREHNTYIEKTALQRFLDRLFARLSRRIVTVSRTVATFTAQQEKIPPEKFVVIHNGIDLERAERAIAALPSKEELRRELGFSNDDRIILNVARLVAQKNHELLIRGFGEWGRNRPEYKLVIVGGGGLEESLRALATREGLGNQIRFFGAQREVGRFYKMADVFASTATIEGLSNAYLEALVSELPLVSTLTAGTDELLVDGRNGFVIVEPTPAAVARALASVTAADMQKLRQEARRTAAGFSIVETVAAYERLFLQVSR